MSRRENAWLAIASLCWSASVACGPALAGQLNINPVSPRNKIISPFGYGPVTQFFASATGGTGQQQCHNLNSALTCLSVSGGNSCSGTAPAAELVSCGSRPNHVNETAFQPVSCNGQPSGDGGVSGLINSDDFCLIANYMPQRTVDNIYQYDDYVRLGVNRRFGGAVFELYGADKVDRILQNTGGGLQLSLWAFDGYASPQYQRAWFAVVVAGDPNWRTDFNTTPYQTLAACQTANPGSQCELEVEGPNLIAAGSSVFPCAGNGGTAAAPYNPLQSQSGDCDIGQSGGYVDSVSSPYPGSVAVTKANPANYTRSDFFQGLTWQQTSRISGPYALVTYRMIDNGALQDTSFQEIPALILHDGLNAYSYFYTGNKPYNDAAGQFSRLTLAQNEQDVLQFPNRQGPFGTGAALTMTEDWVSTCDAQEVSCLTIASFSPSVQDLVVSNPSQAPYFGVHGFFSLMNQLDRTVTIALFPYRIDDVVLGQTVRQWIYQLHTQLNGQ